MAWAQTFTAPDPGPGVVPITGTWQFHEGDDLAWARPGFDDSGWQAISANEPWSVQGHPDYTGYAWYRKRLEIGAGNQPNGILVTPAEGAYEVYWNGERVGSSGKLPPHAVWYNLGRFDVFRLSNGGATNGVLALRFWASPGGLVGLHAPPQFGHLTRLQQLMQFDILSSAHRRLPQIVASALVAAGALLSLLLFFRQRGEKLFLWLSLLLTGYVLATIIVEWMQTITAVPIGFMVQLQHCFTDFGLWLTLLWIFGLHRIRLWRVLTGILIAVYTSIELVECGVVYFQEYGGPIVRIDTVCVISLTALRLFTLVLIGFGLVREKSSSLIPLGLVAAFAGAWIPVLDFVSAYRPAFAMTMRLWGLELGGYHFAAFTLLNWLLLLTLAFTVVRRQLREGRRQAHLEQEMRSAQELQHVLIPEVIPSLPGLKVASVYKPAAEVGGDFFQVIPPELDAPDAGTLIIVGDVSGKGLKAAMTVALIVGTLRTLADATRSPAAILAGLNRRLLGRTQGGFATCIVMRIDGSGTVTLSNAGHLSPFRDGVEWEVPASLPLGLTAEAEYEEVRTSLREAETLTLITDGVLEARNREGELYGFERVSTLMRGRPSVEEVAEAACIFGQDDDITVVSIARITTRKTQPAMGMYPLPALG